MELRGVRGGGGGKGNWGKRLSKSFSLESKSNWVGFRFPAEADLREEEASLDICSTYNFKLD